jgi:hypothetical protein
MTISEFDRDGLVTDDLAQLGTIKIRAIRQIPALPDLGITNSIGEGQTVSLPRWQAYALVEEGYAILVDDDIEIELAKACIKEKGSSVQLFQLPYRDFYARVKDKLKALSNASMADKRKHDHIYALMQELITLRLHKILSQLAASEGSGPPKEVLSDDELELVRSISPQLLSWKKKMLEVR